MNPERRFVVLLFTLAFVSGCMSLQDPTYVQNKEILGNYKYVYIPDISSKSSSSSSAVGWSNPDYGSSITNLNYLSTGVAKEISPHLEIEGYLLKKGIVRIDEINEKNINDTFIVRYGNSGRRDGFWGYALEVTIAFIKPESNEILFMCTAEGIGETETDDIRNAISNCLAGV